MHSAYFYQAMLSSEYFNLQPLAYKCKQMYRILTQFPPSSPQNINKAPLCNNIIIYMI